MIVRIVNILAEMKDTNELVTQPCWTIVEKDLEDLSYTELKEKLA